MSCNSIVPKLKLRIRRKQNENRALYAVTQVERKSRDRKAVECGVVSRV